MLSTPLPKLAISLSCRPGLLEHRGVDAVGDGRHQHVGGLHRLGELGLAHRLVVEVEPRVEQLAHARFDAVRQLARDDDQRFFGLRHACARLSLGLSLGLRFAARSVLFNRARRNWPRPIAVRVELGPSLSDGRFKTKAARAASVHSEPVRCVTHETRQSCSVCDGVCGMLAGTRLRPARVPAPVGRVRQRTAGAALRQPQGRQGQRARRPGQDHDVNWVYQRAGLPVEITAEFENWRRIRDCRRRRGLGLSLAAVGPAHRHGDRQDQGRSGAALREARRRERGDRQAPARRGRHGEALQRRGWCRVTGDGFDGWIQQERLWGVYPNEKVD